MAKVPIKKPDDEGEYGPAMAALDEKKRAFVVARFDGHSIADSARLAGFGNAEGTSTPLTFARIGNRLVNDDRVIAAMGEMFRALIRNAAPEAMSGLRQVMADVHNPNRLKAILAVADRLDAPRQQIDVNVTHKFDPIKITVDLIAERRKQGLTRDEIMRLEDFSEFEMQHYEGLLAERDGPAVETEFDPDLNCYVEKE